MTCAKEATNKSEFRGRFLAGTRDRGRRFFHGDEESEFKNPSGRVTTGKETVFDRHGGFILEEGFIYVFPLVIGLYLQGCHPCQVFFRWERGFRNFCGKVWRVPLEFA